MKLNYNTLEKFQTDLNLVSGIPGDAFSKFFVDNFLVVKAKMEELNKEIENIPAVKEYMDFLNKSVTDRFKAKGNKKVRGQIMQEVLTSLEGTEMQDAKDTAVFEARNKEFDIDLFTISSKDLPANFTGSQRLVIHELIK